MIKKARADCSRLNKIRKFFIRVMDNFLEEIIAKPIFYFFPEIYINQLYNMTV